MSTEMEDRAKRRTPLDAWAREKTGGLPMADWQRDRLRETIRLARCSPFYRARLPDALPETLADFQRFPLMDARDIMREGLRMLCAPPAQIARIVTLYTTGTTGEPKRLHFTAEDLELTVDFFARGLPTIVEPGGVAAVMMPCRTPDGVGDLICRGLAHIPVTAVPHGPLTDFAGAAQMLTETGAQAIVGIPAQVLALTRYLAMTGTNTALRRVLLSADNVPDVLIRELEARGIRAYKHLGLTETGYGCAIDCDAHAGMHIREPDLLIEVIRPETGAPVPDGEWGEIVVTTLTRRGMPMIRYRTGDFSRLLPGVCPCGSALRRLDDVRGRRDNSVRMPGGMLTMRALDEALFALPQVMDFAAACADNALRLRLSTYAGMPPLTECAVREALHALPELGGTSIAMTIERREEYAPLYRSKRLLMRENPA